MDFLQADGIFSNGFGFISKSVMRDRELSIHSKAIYSYICSYTGAGKSAFPSRETICYDLGIGKDTFHKYMKPLLDLGYIVIEKIREQGKFENNLYRVPVSPCRLSSDTVVPDTVSPDTVETDTINNSLINNNYINNNNIKSIDKESDLSSFENLLREKGMEVNATLLKYIQNLLNKMKPEEVMGYLIELIDNLKATQKIRQDINIQALFVHKVKLGERQSAPKIPKPNTETQENKPKPIPEKKEKPALILPEEPMKPVDSAYTSLVDKYIAQGYSIGKATVKAGQEYVLLEKRRENERQDT